MFIENTVNLLKHLKTPYKWKWKTFSLMCYFMLQQEHHCKITTLHYLLRSSTLHYFSFELTIFSRHTKSRCLVNHLQSEILPIASITNNFYSVLPLHRIDTKSNYLSNNSIPKLIWITFFWTIFFSKDKYILYEETLPLHLIFIL